MHEYVYIYIYVCVCVVLCGYTVLYRYTCIIMSFCIITAVLSIAPVDASGTVCLVFGHKASWQLICVLSSLDLMVWGYHEMPITSAYWTFRVVCVRDQGLLLGYGWATFSILPSALPSFARLQSFFLAHGAMQNGLTV